MKKTIICAAIMALGGCASMADSFDKMSGVGAIKTEVSTFDGATITEMTPAFLFENSSTMSALATKIGARWNSKRPGEIDLVLEYSGQMSYLNFAGVDINIDGEISKHTTGGMTAHTDSGYNSASRTIYTESRNSVSVPRELVDRMVSAADCRLRIYTSDGYEDAIFSLDRSGGGQSAARVHMKKFLETIPK